MAIPAETMFLDPDAQGTLQGQIREMIAQGILAGRFRRGERLPSSRKLAAHLGISRVTVTLAYTELMADDYIRSRGRSGYYVSENAPEAPRYAPAPREDRVDWARVLGPRHVVPQLEKPSDWRAYPFPFIYGQTDQAVFDHANWRLCALRALGARDFASLSEDHFDRDDPELISFLIRHTLPRRGIEASPDEVLLTMGAQNALWLAAQALLTQRRAAAIEEPCYPALR
ncbi:MAG: GntR family transcriptional regulator, partial [Shimia sp.]